MLPMTVLRRLDCVLAPTKAKVLAEYEKRKGGKLTGDALDRTLDEVAGQHVITASAWTRKSGDPYIGYFANRYGEQWIFTLDRATGEVCLRGGDAD